MKWQSVLLGIIHCEFKARYSALSGWTLSAKGALPVILLTLTVLVVCGH